MTDTRAPIIPTLDIPMNVATEELTGFEVIAAQKHYKQDLREFGAVRTMVAVVWCYENRREPTSWQTVEAMTLRALNGYFAEPSKEPDDDVGKESSDDGKPTES